MIGRQKTSAWAPAILAFFSLLFASSPVAAWQTPTQTMAMAMRSADKPDSDAPCDPVKMTCARLCAVLCHGLVPMPASVVPVALPADVHQSLPADPLVGVNPESEDPPPRA